MYNLTPANDLIFANSVLMFFVLGIVIFTIFIILMIVLFSYSLKDIIKNQAGFLTLLLISIAIPFSVNKLNQKQNIRSYAADSVEVISSEIVKIDSQNYLVNLVTSKPIVCSLLFKRNSDNLIIPILPSQNLEKRTDHSFLINDVNQGGEIIIVLNGKNYFLNGKPIMIKPE